MTPTAASPDVVFFMVDQLSARWLEAALDGVCDLPHVRRLQQMGTTFTRTISSNPLCCPTRSTLATGLSSRGHGVLENGYALDPALPTWMRALQGSGWQTGTFGKVHFLPHFSGMHPDYTPYGWDVAHITEDGRGGEWLDWVLAEHPEHADAVLATAWATGIPDFAAYGPDQVDLRPRMIAAREKMQWATAAFPENTDKWYTYPFPAELSQTEWITRHALSWINNAAADQPLYAHISYVQPHSPFCAPADCMDAVDPDRIPMPLPAEWVTDPHAPIELKARKPHAPDDWRYARHVYFADLVHLDQQLGQVFCALERRGRLNNTVFVFLSDHGEILYDHGFKSKGEKHYDACIRVPLIIAAPGVDGGRTSDAVVQLEDICPTMLDATATALPPMPVTGPYIGCGPDDVPQLPGRSLLPLCRGETPADWRQTAYSESYNNITSTSPRQWSRTVRDRRWRYTRYAAGGGEQMFDLENDPDEQQNRVADPNCAAERERLRDALLEAVIMQDYPKPRRNLFALGVH
jgi:arylsulfatase A-like enzyme